MDIKNKRQVNEKKFNKWTGLPGGGRRYSFEVKGRHAWRARYVKEVDANEETIRFYQEIYDENGKLVDLHDKYPIDKGHRSNEEE